MTSAQQPSIRDLLVDTFATAAPAKAARTLEDFPASVIAEVLSGLAPAKAALVLGALSPTLPREVLCSMEPGVAASCAENLSVPWLVAVVRDCPKLEPMLGALSAEHRAAIKRASQQSVGLAASLVEPAALAFAVDVKATRVLDLARELTPAERGDVYVVNREGLFAGVVDPLALIDASPSADLSDLVNPSVAVQEDSLLSELAEHPGWSRSRALPVVDKKGVLRGVIRFESLRETTAKSSQASRAPLSVPVSLAELFWLGLTGITDGLARSVTGHGGERDEQR